MTDFPAVRFRTFGTSSRVRCRIVQKGHRDEKEPRDEQLFMKREVD